MEALEKQKPGWRETGYLPQAEGAAGTVPLSEHPEDCRREARKGVEATPVRPTSALQGAFIWGLFHINTHFHSHHGRGMEHRVATTAHTTARRKASYFLIYRA